MKKIIFLLAISICSFMSNAQISGVVNYDSWNWLNYYEYGNMVAFDFYTCQQNLIIDIEFEQEDNYSATQGDLTQQWSSTSYSLEIDFGDLWGHDTIKVYGENQGLMIQFVGYSRRKELESIHVSTWNMIEGDTISICSDYGTDFIKYDLDAYSYGWHHYDSTSIQVGYFDGADFYGFEFHVNDTVFPLYNNNNSINDFNLKTGDVIKVQNSD